MRKMLSCKWAAFFILIASFFTYCDTSAMMNEDTPISGRYTVTYRANGATSGNPPAAEEYAAQSIVVISGNTGGLEKTDFTFSGWNTKTDGTGVTYTQGQCITMKAMNLNLYARWTGEATYTVTYNANGATSGSVPTDSTNYETGMSVTVSANTGGLAKTGYIFAGWNTQANGNGTDYAAGATFSVGTANVTLYAKWALFTFPSGIAVMKGTLLTNPDQPQRMAYVYIDGARDLYLIESADGGVTWGSAKRATYTADCFDFAAAMDGNSTTLVETVNSPSYDGNGASAYWYSHAFGAGSWSAGSLIYSAAPTALCQIPSVFRVTGSAIHFGIGYDTLGGAQPDDTNAYSLFWDGSNMADPTLINLSGATDNPSYVQQIFGESNGNIEYLYFDNHFDYETGGGDILSIPGDSYANWYGFASEQRVLNYGNNQFTLQAYLFRVSSGEYFLAHTSNDGSTQRPYVRHANAVGNLQGASDTQLCGFDVRDLGSGLYRTMYATQESSSGAIHVVWEDKATSGKIWRARIDPESYSSTTFEDVTDTGTLDGVSCLNGELFVSLHDPTTLTAKVVKISTP